MIWILKQELGILFKKKLDINILSIEPVKLMQKIVQFDLLKSLNDRHYASRCCPLCSKRVKTM